MGLPIARTLLSSGMPTTVWNRTRSKADGLAADGAVVAGSVAGAAADAGRLMFGDFPVEFPVTVAVVESYAGAR